jgi:hypothetical protein
MHHLLLVNLYDDGQGPIAAPLTPDQPALVLPKSTPHLSLILCCSLPSHPGQLNLNPPHTYPPDLQPMLLHSDKFLHLLKPPPPRACPQQSRGHTHLSSRAAMPSRLSVVVLVTNL